MTDVPPQDGPVTRFEALARALAADLDTVLAALEPGDRQKLEALLSGAVDRPAEAVLLELEELLVYADLPADHPVSQVLDSNRLAGTQVPRQGVALEESLRLLRATFGGTSPPDSEPESEPPPVAQTGPFEYGSYPDVVHRLFDLPALSPEDVRRVGTDPDLPELIRLRDGETIKLPRFQFDGAGGVRAVVLDVNRTLDAEHDPWGVASWWTDLHAWLERAPVELLDEESGLDELSQLALAEVTP